MREDSAVARTYARALFLAAESKKGPSLKGVEEDLRLAWRLIQSYPNLLSQLTHAMVPIEKKKAALTRAIEEVRPQTCAIVRRFLNLLLEKKRIGILPAITAAYEKRVLENASVVKASVKVPFPLQEKMKDKIVEKLSEFFKKKVTVDVTVQPNLIGGILVQAGDTVLDYSLNSQMKRFGYGN